MSLDRIHDIPGLMQFSAQPAFGSTGTASTIASNQFPGGYQLGAYEGRLAGSNSTNGGAFIVVPSPRGQATSDFQSMSATSGTFTIDNAACLVVSVSTTGGAYCLQPAQAHGQMLTINMIGTTCSYLSVVTTTGNGAGSTTTSSVKVVDVAGTIASSGAIFQALAQLGGTATNSTSFVWHRVV